MKTYEQIFDEVLQEYGYSGFKDWDNKPKPKHDNWEFSQKLFREVCIRAQKEALSQMQTKYILDADCHLNNCATAEMIQDTDINQFIIE